MYLLTLALTSCIVGLSFNMYVTRGIVIEDELTTHVATSRLWCVSQI
jgi:hypothetical protein